MTERSFPIIDAHTHLFYNRSYLPELFQGLNLRAGVINVTGHGLFETAMKERWQAMVALKQRYPEHIFLATTFEPADVTEPGFANRVLDKLRRDLNEGATLVKVWKDIGLRVRDSDGSWIQVDDARFQPIWDFLARQNIPVLAHIAEPKAAWQPLDRRSPHFQYYRNHPQHHLNRQPEVPSWEEIIAARDRWVEANPDLLIVGAHFGSMAHDLDEVATRLEQFPNFYVDTAERFGDLYVQPASKVQRFFEQYADRILYGTDVLLAKPSVENEEFEQASYRALLSEHWSYFRGAEEIRVQDKLTEPITTEGLNLSHSTLKKVYYRNAKRLCGL